MPELHKDKTVREIVSLCRAVLPDTALDRELKRKTKELLGESSTLMLPHQPALEQRAPATT